jgi:monovalent cation/hydrogen antiporter
MPMMPTTQLLVVLLAVLAAVAIMAARLRVPPAVLLVLTGVALALIPGLPAIELAPDVVLLLVLPPVIYNAAVAMDWREFRDNLRPISSLAVGSVLFTTVATAAATHLLLGMPWSVGFVLGAIVSPPDTMAPGSIAHRMQIPRRILVILEGEGLANDATALILYRFAVAAVSIGAFSFGDAMGTFVVIIGGEILWGIGVGWVTLRLRRWINEPRIEVTLSVLTPFLAYWPPDHLGGSGVLATVTTGLYVSWAGPSLIKAATRLQGIFFWDLFIYLIEGMVFLVTGLHARTLISRIGDHHLSEFALSALVVSAVVILARFLWNSSAAYLPRRFNFWLGRHDPAPPWQWVFTVAFTGIRGIVSLAAALSLPLQTASGAAFPERDLILVLTFVVILVTLVGQGLLLPWVIRLLGLADAGRDEHEKTRAQEYAARKRAIEAALHRFDSLSRQHHLAPEWVADMRRHHADRLRLVRHSSDGDHRHRRSSAVHDDIELALIDAERQEINALFRQGKLNDEARRHIERELDLREAQLLNARTEP